MSDRTLPEQKDHVNKLLGKARERDAYIKEEMNKAETTLSYTASDKDKRRTLMTQMIRMRERQVKRWRDIVREIETLDARLVYLGDDLEARTWRRIRDTYSAMLEDGEEDLNTRQALYSKCT